MVWGHRCCQVIVETELIERRRWPSGCPHNRLIQFSRPQGGRMFSSKCLRFVSGKPSGLLTALMLFALPLQAANYTLTVEPTYTPERAAEVYQPLLDYLQQSTGHQFTLIAPRNHHFFWRDLRQNIATDFVFEEAQFVDYRVQRFQFVPIARTVEDSRYSLIALPEVAEQGWMD